MTYPVAMLYNTATQRFHPIFFEPRPRPSDTGDIVRHKSLGHHTIGFPTIENAREHTTARDDCKDSGLVLEWDGKGVPALCYEFSLSEYGNTAQTA
jgi:hypothetical protein